MIDELKILESIIGKLTGAGIWGLVAYIVYSLIKMIISWGIGSWLVYKIATMISEHCKAPCTRDEFERLKSERSNAIRETEKVLHQYKIMREKMDDKSE